MEFSAFAVASKSGSASQTETSLGSMKTRDVAAARMVVEMRVDAIEEGLTLAFETVMPHPDAARAFEAIATGKW